MKRQIKSLSLAAFIAIKDEQEKRRSPVGQLTDKLAKLQEEFDKLKKENDFLRGLIRPE